MSRTLSRGCRRCGKPTSFGRRTCDECALAASLDLDAAYASLPPERRPWGTTINLMVETSHPDGPTAGEIVAALRDLLDNAPDFLTFAACEPVDIGPSPDAELRRAALDSRGRP